MENINKCSCNYIVKNNQNKWACAYCKKEIVFKLESEIYNRFNTKPN